MLLRCSVVAQLRQCTGASVVSEADFGSRADFARISPPHSLSPQRIAQRAHISARCFRFAMQRPVLITQSGNNGIEVAVEPLGVRAEWKVDADIGFLQGRFPGICPHHLHHNLLQLHYSRHPSCTAQPFTNQQCQHGSHQKPLLTMEQMQSTAPAEGANILLPFGLSCRNSDDDVGLVAGCADCETLEPGDTCGCCRRLWHEDRPVPAEGYYRNLGGSACLEGWRDAINLPAQVHWPEEEQEEEMGEGEEECGEAEWPEEEYEEEEYEEEEWEGEADAEEEAEGYSEESWSRGDWSKDRRGNWEWSMDFTSGKAADAAPLQPAAGLAEVVAAAVQAAVAGTQAKPAPLARASAPAQALDPRARLRELELELATFRHEHGL